MIIIDFIWDIFGNSSFWIVN